MGILGILFVLLLRTYSQISSLVFRVQQEKSVAQEILQLSQMVQNLSDRNQIDYQRYTDLDLSSTEWISDVLYLSGQDGQITLFSSGSCIEPSEEYSLTGRWSPCSLYVDISGSIKELINTNRILISKPLFKIIPFASESQYLHSENLCEQGKYIYCINAPWFWMIFTAYSVNYGTQRATHVSVPFQQFF